MSVHFITGKLGAGKTLCAVSRIQHYLNNGLIVATNLDLNMHEFSDIYNKSHVIYRLPDKPETKDMESIGIGNHSYDEEKNGLVVLDECGTWFNSRNWNDKGRQELINWFLHARKKGWDVIFIVQDLSIIDKQARETLCEHAVFCRRFDKLKIPLLTSLFSLFDIKLRPPKLHMAVVKYGDSKQYPTVDRWWYFGNTLYDLYDTKQAFIKDEFAAVYSYLTPWHVAGRYTPRKTILEMLTPYFIRYAQICAYSVVVLSAVCRGRSLRQTAYDYKLIRPKSVIKIQARDYFINPLYRERSCDGMYFVL